MSKKKVLVGISGGVDSAVSAYLLQQEGYEVYGGFMVNYLAPQGEYCPTKEDLAEARKVSDFLGLKDFFIFNYVDEYEDKVLNYMYEGYKKGITPNPDIMCNSEIKFRVFLDEAMAAGFDYIATGHYANITCDDKGIYHLKKGVDNNKDQSYFLAGLGQDQLSKAIFPIGNLEKSEVRKIAEKIGLPNAKRKDSQGICFVGKVDMSKFLEKKIPNLEGNIVDTSGNILGKHKGIFYYTIGQRKGLGIGGGPAIYVVGKDIEKNEIIVGGEKDLALFSQKLTANNVHYLAEKIEMPFKAKAKTRYRQADQDCEVFDLGGGRIKVEFKEPQRAITSGQVVAIYKEDELIVSAFID
ncbi:MAG: tRNA 2-thiouridine(34) synthase MnmA [Candidatus Gracilibacteria bacterium]|nr:tRNA 2-thiouridine(34) synthase MnmA [Candidatus Gracilibacteria bacterium]